MIFNKFLNNRFALSTSFILGYLILQFIVRASLYILSFSHIDFSIFTFFSIFSVGLVYDFGVALFAISFYAFYLLLIPKILIGSFVDKFFTYGILLLTFFIIFFSTLAEFPFWEEFSNRFNFIAVDYLIYTYEVIENINQSFPIPWLVSLLVLLCLLSFFVLWKTKLTKVAFEYKTPFKYRFAYFSVLILISALHIQSIDNKQADYSKNTYVNELSKNGTYSFVSAYISNELDYDTFYARIEEKKSFKIIKKELLQKNQKYINDDNLDIYRYTKKDSTIIKPNVILVCIESFNANFMAEFGNTDKITPFIDTLSQESILFTNMYATGTRTVRGMEAIILSVPPTPGHSIVRRPNNNNLYSVASILKEKNYKLNFFYGGDGYFDNMNSFFGGQGFNIIDRNRGNPLSDNIHTSRTNIEDNEVSFENAWGICDEDVYSKVLKIADANYENKEPTFSFVMTTSNHRPYSFPENKIKLKQGSRKAAVKYTDYALRNFINEAKKKKWFKNTVFVIIADHCASSAGKWNINIDKHHIPALIYNLPNRKSQKINKLVSQIDILPTLFSYLNWNYSTALYGMDINKMNKNDERALIGNYRTIGLLKDSIFTELNDRKNINQYLYNANIKSMGEYYDTNKKLENLCISYYQTASTRYKKGLMKEILK